MNFDTGSRSVPTVNQAALGKRARRILAAKAARTYIIAHPGCTSAEVFEATGAGAGMVQELGLAAWKRDAAGVARWYVKPGVSRPWHPHAEERAPNL